MKVIVTGGAGFIAALLIPRLLEQGYEVLALDNLCRGALSNMEAFAQHPHFRFVQVDLSDLKAYERAVRDHGEGHAAVWHLAANSDIPAGVADPSIDLRDTFMTTFNTLQVMRSRAIGALYFASSSAIYGDFGDRHISEDAGPLLPISNYGAMKLASEAQISAARESFLGRCILFRFPNVVGAPATHGVILDFIRRLRDAPDQLTVLGNGRQQKAYLHAAELVDAMLYLVEKTGFDRGPINIGPRDDGVSVRTIAEETVKRCSPQARIVFGDQDRGWVGDVPRVFYATDLLASLGWKPQLSSVEAIRRSVDEIAIQEGWK